MCWIAIIPKIKVVNADRVNTANYQANQYGKPPKPTTSKLMKNTKSPTSRKRDQRRSVKKWRLMPARFKVFVKGIPWEWTKEEVSKFFSSCGRISAVTLPRNPVTGGHRGFCFVQFNNVEAAVNALKLDGFQLVGLPRHIVIRVQHLKPKQLSQDVNDAEEDIEMGTAPDPPPVCSSISTQTPPPKPPPEPYKFPEMKLTHGDEREKWAMILLECRHLLAQFNLELYVISGCTWGVCAKCLRQPAAGGVEPAETVAMRLWATGGGDPRELMCLLASCFPKAQLREGAEHWWQQC